MIDSMIEIEVAQMIFSCVCVYNLVMIYIWVIEATVIFFLQIF